MGVKLLQSYEEWKDAKEDYDYVVLDISADFCGPCKGLAPFLDELARKLSKKVKFFKIEFDKCDFTEESKDFSLVTAFPTLKFYENGKLVHKQEGANKKALVSYLNKWVDADIEIV